MPADTLDITTLGNVKDLLAIDGVDNNRDAELQRLVTVASRRIDDLCGPVVARTITAERHSPSGLKPIRLRRQPILSVSSVVQWRSGSDTTFTAETDSTAGDYLLDVTNRWNPKIRRRSSWCDIRWLPGDVLVTYSAGRYADTADVDPLFEEAAGLIVVHLFKSTGPAFHTQQDYFDQTPTPATYTPRWGVPKAVTDLLHDELEPPVVA